MTTTNDAAVRAEPDADARNPLPRLGSIGSGLDAEVGVRIQVPGEGGASEGAGSLRSGPAWSTIKVPIALRVLEDAGGPGGLTRAERSDIESAIAASDNEAAARLFATLVERYGGTAGAAAAVTEVLRRAGDRGTEVSTEGRDGFSPYGQTQWSLAAQARFMAALAGGCLTDPAVRRVLLDAMSEVSVEPWGLGSLAATRKGGWGPDPGGAYLVRQMGLVRAEGGSLAVAIAVRPSDGTFETGASIASDLAQALAERLQGGISLERADQVCK